MNSDELDILLVEDNQDDVDLALHALRREKLANHIFVAAMARKLSTFCSVAERSREDRSIIPPNWCCWI